MLFRSASSESYPFRIGMGVIRAQPTALKVVTGIQHSNKCP